MASDSDVVLVGTGVGPLVAASYLLAQGRSVLLLNPDSDFFWEASELGLDPLWPISNLTAERLRGARRKRALSVLRPEFPGAIELWSSTAEGDAKPGYHDCFAPHVRTRNRLWVEKKGKELEELYLCALAGELNPAMAQGATGLKTFPGFSKNAQAEEMTRALLLPKMCDVDVTRYQNGLLEFIRERLGPERLMSNVSQLDFASEGIKFHAAGTPRSVRIKGGLVVFWTPRLTNWVLAQAKKLEVKIAQPQGIRLWEEWSLLSREPLDPSSVGMFDDLTVWADVEGCPDHSSTILNKLSVLRPGPLIGIDKFFRDEADETWASSASFSALSALCETFLRWDKFSVRLMRSRRLFQWSEQDISTPISLMNQPFSVQIVSGADGPLVDVVDRARQAATFMDGKI